MLSVPQSTDYSEGASNALACSSQCYQPVQYHKYPVPLNLQPHGQQQICLSIILFQKRFHTGDTGANTGIIKLVRHGTTMLKSLKLSTQLLTSKHC